MRVYGKNVAKELLNSDYNIKKIYMQEGFNNEEILKLINKKKLNVIVKSQSDMDKMERELHQGIIMEIEDYRYLDLNDIKNDRDASFVVILDHIEDPRNFGAIIRTCECAGVDYIIVPNKRGVEVNATVMKTSSGALTNTKIVMVSNLRNAMETLKKLNFWVIGTDMDGKNYTDIDYTSKTALVIGNEGSGLKQIVRNSCDEIASIPLLGKVNSLNASVAAAVTIYEVVRQRSNG